MSRLRSFWSTWSDRGGSGMCASTSAGKAASAAFFWIRDDDDDVPEGDMDGAGEDATDETAASLLELLCVLLKSPSLSGSSQSPMSSASAARISASRGESSGSALKVGKNGSLVTSIFELFGESTRDGSVIDGSEACVRSAASSVCACRPYFVALHRKPGKLDGHLLGRDHNLAVKRMISGLNQRLDAVRSGLVPTKRLELGTKFEGCCCSWLKCCKALVQLEKQLLLDITSWGVGHTSSDPCILRIYINH
jgi:hypothetical protein